MHINLHLAQDDSANFCADVTNRAVCKGLIAHAEAERAAGIRIENQHARGRIDAAIHHVIDLVLLDGTGWLATFVVDDRAFAQTCVEHPIENIRMASLGKHKRRTMRFYRWNQIFILPRNIQNLDTLQIDVCLIGKILKPCQNVGIGKKIVFHDKTTPLHLISYIISHFCYKCTRKSKKVRINCAKFGEYLDICEKIHRTHSNSGKARQSVVN